jgi:threonine dehydratase
MVTDNDVPTVSAHDVDEARKVQQSSGNVVVTTPLQEARWLSERAEAPVYLKCENLQRTGSFKIRGAIVRMSRLSAEERAHGVVAASAGNHAQGVALAAQHLGIRATVFMPEGAPIPKEKATRGYGAELRFHGHTVDEALTAAQAFTTESGAVLIHPFDHPDIVAGQGTCGTEILEQCPDVATVLVPLGGGGLLAGIATAVKSARPGVRVVGVQAERAAAYPGSLEAGVPTPVTGMATMADGIAVGCPGKVPFASIQTYVDEVITVSEESMSTALLQLLERAKMVVEPAGAAAVAAMLDPARRFDGPVVPVLSGGNIDPLLLMRVIRHGMASAGRYLSFRVRIPDRPGGLAQLLGELARSEANVLDVVHQRTSAQLHLDEVEVALQVETRGAEHREEVLAHLRSVGYPPEFG